MLTPSPFADSCLAFSLALAISIPSFLGNAYSFKPLFYCLVLLPTIGFILVGRISLPSLLRDNPEVILISTLLLYWSLTALWSPEPENFVSLLGRTLATFVFIVAVIHISSTQRSGLLLYLDLALALVAIGALYRLSGLLSSEPRSAVWRLGDGSIFHRSLHASHYFGFFAVYGLIRVYHNLQSGKKWVYLAGMLPPLLFVLATESRGPIISFFLVYLGATIFWYKKPAHAALAILAALLLLTFQYDALTGRGTSYRLEIWRGSWELATQNFWFGVGLGEPLSIPYKDHRLAPHAHNLFLDTLVKTGIVGLAGLVAPLVMILRRAVNSREDERVFTATLLFFIACMMTDVYKLLNSPSGTYVVFWLPLIVLMTTSPPRKTGGA